DLAVVGFAHQQGPFSSRNVSIRSIRGQRLQVTTPVIIAKFIHSLGISHSGNLRRVVNRVEIGGEGCGNPIISGNLVVAANDDAVLTGQAPAQNDRRGGAHSGEIHGGVPGRIESAEVAVRLFQKKRDVGPGRQGRNQNQQAQNPEPLLRHLSPSKGDRFRRNNI